MTQIKANNAYVLNMTNLLEQAINATMPPRSSGTHSGSKLMTLRTTACRIIGDWLKAEARLLA
jgi:hypothetical protein